MTRGAIRIGLLFSTTGSYQALGCALLRGALLAAEQVNADPSIPLRLDPVVLDPGGRLARYSALSSELLRREGVTHVVGCYTSSSRKEVLPIFEKYDALLWYPSHYEGFETSESVIYTGAAPNQHIVPLSQHLLERHGSQAWLAGSNYIWAWENNRILREALQGVGGSVLGERYFPVGDTDFEALVDQILESRPDFVFNTMIGESAYAFFRAFQRIAPRHGLDARSQPPIASCSLCEPELLEIGAAADSGHLSSSVYFETVETAANRAFVAAWRKRFTGFGPTSADAEASYNAVHLLARALAKAGSEEVSAVREASAEVRFDAPQGEIWLDGQNHHCFLTPRIGRSMPGGRFEILYQAKAPVRPDPYLLWHSPRVAYAQKQGPNLRVV